MQRKQKLRRYSAGKVSLGWIVTIVCVVLLLAYLGYGLMFAFSGYGHV